MLRAIARDSGDPMGKSAGLKLVAISKLRLFLAFSGLGFIYRPLTFASCCTYRGLTPFRKRTGLRVVVQLVWAHTPEHFGEVDRLRSLNPPAPRVDSRVRRNRSDYGRCIHVHIASLLDDAFQRSADVPPPLFHKTQRMSVSIHRIAANGLLDRMFFGDLGWADPTNEFLFYLLTVGMRADAATSLVTARIDS